MRGMLGHHSVGEVAHRSVLGATSSDLRECDLEGIAGGKVSNDVRIVHRCDVGRLKSHGHAGMATHSKRAVTVHPGSTRTVHPHAAADAAVGGSIGGVAGRAVR